MLIFFMILSLTGNAVLFLCLNSLFKKNTKKRKEKEKKKTKKKKQGKKRKKNKTKQKSIPDFFLWMHAYTHEYLHL